jgi:hypothetical protein
MIDLKSLLPTLSFSAVLLSLSACGSMESAGMDSAASSAQSASGPAFAVLSAAPEAGGAVTCTDSSILGDVGSSGAPASIVQTNCSITGAIIAPVSSQDVFGFYSQYDALAATPCDQTLTGTLAGITLSPGVYCFDAAATLTGTLTLSGPSNGIWLFKVGTAGTGALTGTNFSVVLAGGASECNVTWWVAEAATMTTSNFIGTIYAGAAITVTGGTYHGDALAKAAVTLTGATLAGCEVSSTPIHTGCNQGVGNGAEGCDPGNSNQGNPGNSNDENGGTPGNPGKKGGKK